MWFGIRTSNGRKCRKSVPLADNKHCYVVVVVYLWVSVNGSVAFWRGFGSINLRNEVKNFFEHTFQNRHFRQPKIWGFGLRRTGKKFTDSDVNSESVTTLKYLPPVDFNVLSIEEENGRRNQWNIEVVDIDRHLVYSYYVYTSHQCQFIHSLCKLSTVTRNQELSAQSRCT